MLACKFSVRVCAMCVCSVCTVCVCSVSVCIQSLCLCFEDAPRYVRRQQSAVWAITKGQKPSTICELANLLSRFVLLLSLSLSHSHSLSWCWQFVAWPATCLILYQIYNWLIGTWQWDYACQASMLSLSLSHTHTHVCASFASCVAWSYYVYYVYAACVVCVKVFAWCCLPRALYDFAMRALRFILSEWIFNTPPLPPGADANATRARATTTTTA